VIRTRVARPQRSGAAPAIDDNRGVIQALLGDGRFLIALTGVSLILSGGFAVLQSFSGQLLPHDSHAIGMDAMALRQAGNAHLLGFMFHDRVAYGGALIAIGSGYVWAAGFPLLAGAQWAWWALLTSGTLGFLSFLTWLGQGYLDTWHGVATLFLLPVYIAGMWRACPRNLSLRSAFPPMPPSPNLFEAWGRRLLFVDAAGLTLAGATIAAFGMTTVFVPSDLRFIGLGIPVLREISPMLIPVISHDRAGFGGGLFSIGSFLLFTAKSAQLSRSLVEMIAVMGLSGFGCAIGIHFVVGYTDLLHLLPAFFGFAVFIAADVLLWLGYRRALPGTNQE
jgi:hypothetical protein